MSRRIFVFGSNLAGRHGRGAAKFAVEKFGAILGQGSGLQGSSYAIPTKDERLRTLHLWQIQLSIIEFMNFAKQHADLTFNVTRVGCGLAGYTEQDIAPMFKGAPKNCVLPKGWRDL
jgi:hypothetical protein